MRIVNIHMTGKENFKMRNRIIQVRHYSRKMMIMMLTGAICCSSCFCETAFAKTSKVRVYDVEKGTTSFTSFTYSDNKNDESLAPSEEQKRFHLLLRRWLFSIRQMGLR